MSGLKRMALRGLLLPGAAGALSVLLRDRAVIFMMHRLCDPDLGIAGHQAEEVRSLLAYLRRHRYEIVSLEEVFRRLRGEGPPPAGCVAFTLDDGYEDQAVVAGPIFAEFDCPATTFVTTGFLDGKLWFWWDRIAYVFHHTQRPDVQIEAEGRALHFDLASSGARDRAADDFIALCKTISDEAKHGAIAELVRAAEVELPERPPPGFAPMSWDQLRACEKQGMSFGPHTVSHPVLSRAGDGQSKQELEEGWARLRAEAASPVPVFCYPNGQFSDFGEREINTLREMGMAGAVVGAPGYASAAAFQNNEVERFEVRRFALPSELIDLVQLASGFERLKQVLRREDTPVIGWMLDRAAALRGRLEQLRIERRWARLREQGMHIGSDVWLPDSTWIDACHCHLIRIEDHTGFGEQCMILAHDAQMDEFLDAARIGRVLIRESCHIGSRTVVLPGVEVGPRTLVGSNSVISRSLPPDTVCAGNPAKVICSLEEYLARHRERIEKLPTFPYDEYDIRALTPERRAELVRAVASDDAYIVGGRSAELRGDGGTPRTMLDE